MKQEFRQYPDGRILALTGETPAGLKDAVFIGWTGTPDSLEEVAIPKDKLPPVVSVIPDEWKAALESKGFNVGQRPETRGQRRRPEAEEFYATVMDILERQKRLERFIVLCACGLALFFLALLLSI